MRTRSAQIDNLEIRIIVLEGHRERIRNGWIVEGMTEDSIEEEIEELGLQIMALELDDHTCG